MHLALHKGNIIVRGRKSRQSSLYSPEMATYSSDDKFNHQAAEGFIYVWGLPTRIWAQNQRQKL